MWCDWKWNGWVRQRVMLRRQLVWTLWPLFAGWWSCISGPSGELWGLVGLVSSVRCIQTRYVLIPCRRMLAEIVAIFNRGIFVQCLTCGVTLCIVGYRILIVSMFGDNNCGSKTWEYRICEWNINLQAEMFSNDFFAMILLLSGFLGEIFYYCHYGNEIKLKSESLSEALYSCRWYDFRCTCNDRCLRSHQRVLKTSISIIMERLKRPAIVQAGYLLDLTYDTFIAVRASRIWCATT